MPVECSYQPGRAYHTTHVDQLDFAAARAAWGIEGRWGALFDLFPDLGESAYESAYDHVELLIRARVYDAQTFTLLTDPQSIMATGVLNSEN